MTDAKTGFRGSLREYALYIAVVSCLLAFCFTQLSQYNARTQEERKELRRELSILLVISTDLKEIEKYVRLPDDEVTGQFAVIDLSRFDSGKDLVGELCDWPAANALLSERAVTMIERLVGDIGSRTRVLLELCAHLQGKAVSDLLIEDVIIATWDNLPAFLEMGGKNDLTATQLQWLVGFCRNVIGRIVLYARPPHPPVTITVADALLYRDIFYVCEPEVASKTVRCYRVLGDIQEKQEALREHARSANPVSWLFQICGLGTDSGRIIEEAEHAIRTLMSELRQQRLNEVQDLVTKRIKEIQERLD
ncbi:MAG: hypothetical protein JSW03_03295 [Candidatus Eiseniibacteriota bacterium]|nr:MAG: hypothetical protein JSW03_03295 [Candidatus Eisenbacteria bacterium]